MAAKFNHHKSYAWLFIIPQLVITLVFFIWPACGAVVQSFFFSDAFGLHRHFAGLIQFTDLFEDPSYLNALWITLVIAVSVTLITMSLGLFLASLVAAKNKSQGVYKSLLIWPYAVAPAVAAILWRFLMPSDFRMVDSDS